MNKFKRLLKKAGLEEMKSSLLQAQLIDFMSVQNYYQTFEAIVGITKFPIFSIQDNFNGSDNEIIKHIIQNDNNVFTYLWANNVAQFGNPTIDENEIKQHIEVELQNSNQFMLIINNADLAQNQTSSELEVIDFDGAYWDDESPRDKITYYIQSSISTENYEELHEKANKAIERFVNEKFGVDVDYTECFFENSSLHNLLAIYKDDLFQLEISPGSGTDEQFIENLKKRKESEQIDTIVFEIMESKDVLQQAKDLENMIGRNAIVEFAVENSEIEYVDK